MKVVADTNVIISMLLWGKSLEQLFVWVNERKVILCFSPETIDELLRVIEYPHIQKQAEKLNEPIVQLTDKLISASLIYYPDIKINAVKEDPSDNRLLEAAVTAKATYLISGDKHLTKLQSFNSVIILTPADFFLRFK